MAELINNQSKGGTKQRRGIRRSTVPQVDLTAMVDLAFLLITFFMLTTSLSTLNQLDVAMPDKSILSPPVLLSEDRTLSLLLGGNNEVVYYLGTSDSPKTGPGNITYGKPGIEQLLVSMKEAVAKSTGGQEIFVLIKPSDASVTRNLVDAVDAVKKAGIGRFMITKANDIDKEML